MKMFYIALAIGFIAAFLPHPVDFFFIAGAVGFLVFRDREPKFS